MVGLWNSIRTRLFGGRSTGVGDDDDDDNSYIDNNEREKENPRGERVYLLSMTMVASSNGHGATAMHNGTTAEVSSQTTTTVSALSLSGGAQEGDSDYEEGGDPGSATLWSERSTEETAGATDWLSPSGNWLLDLWKFTGPAWLVSIAYVDPGNYQADIQAGSTSRYALLFALWWTSILSIYVQFLCVRLAYRGRLTLAQAQARDGSLWASTKYLNWFLAELSTVLTDLPEVIGIGIACNIFFGWDYYIGVILSLLTTMLFLFIEDVGRRGYAVLEFIIFLFVLIMAVALFVEMDFVGSSATELLQGWSYGFVKIRTEDVFAVTGILGSVVMPHNLYLHTGACQVRAARVAPRHVKWAIAWSSVETVVPIILSFFVNMAVVSIAAESVYGEPNAARVGLTNFCDYFRALAKGGCLLWAVALLAAGQSSAITTTKTGQVIMDGFLDHLRPSLVMRAMNRLHPSRQLQIRAVMTRLVAITPCVICSIAFPDSLNQMVNVVNSSLSFLLPFAFTPLVRYNCSPAFMGGEHSASKGSERVMLWSFAWLVWAINAFGLSARGGGLLGDVIRPLPWSTKKSVLTAIELALQLFYFVWNFCAWWFPPQMQDDASLALGSDATPMAPISSENGEATRASSFEKIRQPPILQQSNDIDETRLVTEGVLS